MDQTAGIDTNNQMKTMALRIPLPANTQTQELSTLADFVLLINAKIPREKFESDNEPRTRLTPDQYVTVRQ
ncbi:MAG TPA: hypothetical protein DDW73_22065 [Rhizobium sp.]|nr:hypothetical protein [Rhizobium sp.]